MLFSSATFLFLFLPLTLLVYFVAATKYKNAVLIFMSLVFYAWSGPSFVLLMLFSIAANYIFAIFIDRAKNRDKISQISANPSWLDSKKILLIAAIFFNVVLLCYYKYANFIIENLLAALHVHSRYPLFSEIILPIGISFFTFHALSYVIDVYRGDAPVQKNPFRIALYISLFPQLIAGPIVRYKNIAAQLPAESRTIDRAAFSYGIQRFIIGLGKKMLIADALGAYADQIFGRDPSELTAFVAFMGVVYYAVQIYFDFSGYTDMAIGLGKMFGFDFPENFNYPYISRSIQEFWRRWHMSLSLWFRDYVYIPLGGSREGKFKTYFNLWLTFLLVGIWHGANWTFAAWGIWNGFFLILERTRFAQMIKGGITGFTGRIFAHIYALFVIGIGWVLFRSETIPDAWAYAKALFGFGSRAADPTIAILYFNKQTLAVLILGIIFSIPTFSWLKQKWAFFASPVFVSPLFTYASCIVIFILCILAAAGGTQNAFIYFRF